MVILLFFIFGAMIGSFLNALIYRLPREINIAVPRSSCPHCGKLIYWYENIPILSFLFLRGKCSGCGERISIEYPILEFISGVVAVVLMPKVLNESSIVFYLFYFSIFSCFLVHLVVDLKHKILPDSINIYLLCLFLIHLLIYGDWRDGLIGAAIGFGLTYFVTWAFYKLRGQIGLGGGDIKLFGVLGLYLGPLGIIHNIFLSCFLGALIGVALILSKRISRETQIPFGPFILIVATFQIFFSEVFNRIMNHLFLLS